MTDGLWWATFFEGSALELWRRAHSRAESRAQAADIAEVLGLVRGERVLDVPCGNGRLALELAARELRVSGLDASREFLEEATECARELGLELDLRHGDMRALPWSQEFDAAFCAGNSFGYFDEAGDSSFLEAVARALRPGGRFLLEAPLVAELVLRQREYRDWRQLGERLLLSEACYDDRLGRLDARYTFVDLSRVGGALETRAASYRVYSAHEIVTRLEACGFDAIRCLGSLDGSPFDAQSREFHVRAMRR